MVFPSNLLVILDARAGGKPDIRQEWSGSASEDDPVECGCSRSRTTRGLNANDAWRIAHDRKSCRALRPVVGQAFH